MHSAQTMTSEDSHSVSKRLVLVAIGSNLGDRWWILNGALEELAALSGYRLLDCAPVWETPPWGVEDQPGFLNTVLALEALDGSPEALLQDLLLIEQRFGRVRREKWGPRTLDLDLLMWGEELRATEALALPHPRMREREFVMVPLGHLLQKHPEWQHEWLVEWRLWYQEGRSSLGEPAGYLRWSSHV
jgi:2-amino-4-hydroxy-6-hydroxymethyldihydropteridine diphosphokinase